MRRTGARGILVGFLLLVAACGGGGGSSVGPTPDAKVGGLWTGTLTIGGVAYDIVAMSSETGELELVESGSASFLAQYWGTLSSTGNDVSATFTGAVLNVSAPFSDGSLRGTGTASGTIKQRSSITASVAFTTSKGKAITGQLALTYDSSYAQASSLSAISGNYTSAVTPGSDSMSITTAGVLNYTDPLTTQCMGTGMVTIIDSSYAVYAGQMTLSNCTGVYASLNGTSLQGLATVDANAKPKLMGLMMHGAVLGVDSPFFLLLQGT